MGPVLQACLSAVVCQVKAVLYLAKGQLSSPPTRLYPHMLSS